MTDLIKSKGGNVAPPLKINKNSRPVAPDIEDAGDGCAVSIQLIYSAATVTGTTETLERPPLALNSTTPSIRAKSV